jgi:hypothetical protein
VFVLDFTKSCNSAVSVAIAEHDYGVLIFIFLFVVQMMQVRKKGAINYILVQKNQMKGSFLEANKSSESPCPAMHF